MSQAIDGIVWEGGTAWLYARVVKEVVGSAAAAIVQADVASITGAVYDVTAPSTAAVTITGLAVADLISDTLQPFPSGGDATGWNFRYVLAPSYMPKGGHVYWVDFTVTLTDGSVLKVEFRPQTARIPGAS